MSRGNGPLARLDEAQNRGWVNGPSLVTRTPGSDNVKVRFGYAQNASEKASNEMGELGGAVECDTPVSPGRIGEDTPRLHRRGYVAMDAVSVLEGAVRHREGAVRITDVLVTSVDDVGAER